MNFNQHCTAVKQQLCNAFFSHVSQTENKKPDEERFWPALVQNTKLY